MSCSVYDTERLIERASDDGEHRCLRVSDSSVVHGGSALRATKRTSNSTPKYAFSQLYLPCSCAHGVEQI